MILHRLIISWACNHLIKLRRVRGNETIHDRMCSVRDYWITEILASSWFYYILTSWKKRQCHLGFFSEIDDLCYWQTQEPRYWKHEQTAVFRALFTVCLQRERKWLIFTPVSPPTRPRSSRTRTRKRNATRNQKPASWWGWLFCHQRDLQHGSSNVLRPFCYFARANNCHPFAVYCATIPSRYTANPRRPLLWVIPPPYKKWYTVAECITLCFCIKRVCNRRWDCYCFFFPK